MAETPRPPAAKWAKADQYDAYVGRWSGLVAERFVRWLDVSVGSRWLDVGCGTGALTETIVRTLEPAEVVGIDPSEPFVRRARERVTDRRVTFRVGDAQRLPDDLGGFDAVVSALVLTFIPDVEQAMSEMRRVVRGGGVVAAYVWDYAGQMELMRTFWDAAADLDAQARAFDEGRRFSISQPQALRDLFDRHLSQVALVDLVVPTVFRSFDDYWSPFLGGQGPAPAYAASLDDDRRTQLRDLIRSRLPIADDGSIALKARAWAVMGRRS